jgi:beta-glucanase (GH16 family)
MWLIFLHLFALVFGKPQYAYPGFSADGDWIITFEEEFNASTLDLTKWNVKNNQTHCSPCELQLYVNGGVSVADGNLVITTKRDHILGPNGQVFNFSSGWIDTHTKFSQPYGLFEASGKLAPQSSTGYWPAFWTLPANQSICWPTGGEIDVFEYTANPTVNDVFGSFRWGTACNNDKQILPGAAYPGLMQKPIDWSVDYHTFAATWNETAITFFVDGHAYETKTSTEVNIPNMAHYVILNAAVAWYYPPGPKAIYPATTYFDWVRVYRWASQ